MIGQTQLAIMYYHGWGVQQNKREAYKLFKLAADQDYAEAQLYMGRISC